MLRYYFLPLKKKITITFFQLLGKSGSELPEEESYIMPDEESIPVDLPNCIVNEDSLGAHLKSKRNARSKKLLDEGRLKTILNADGKIDEEETPAFFWKTEIYIRAKMPNRNKKASQRG
ncbi:hypothetical protein ACFX2F_025735 [Malus domestica]